MEFAELGAMVISLRARHALTVRQHMGRAAQHVCLHLVRQVDPALSAELHAIRQVKPYAASGLLMPGSTRPLLGRVAPGDRTWLRLVGLRADVVKALHQGIRHPPDFEPSERDRLPAEERPAVWLEHGTLVAEFDNFLWVIEAFTWSDHPWAGYTTYADLAQQHHNAAPPRAVSFEFASPTAFSSADLNIPLPDPLRVFDSLRQQWDALNTMGAAFALPETFTEFVRHFVPLSQYSAHTEAVKLKTPEIGFCAERVMFDIKRRVSVGRSLRKNKPEYARELDALNEQRDDLARVAVLLADFAFYCGVGIKTTTGMGMVRQR